MTLLEKAKTKKLGLRGRPIVKGAVLDERIELVLAIIDGDVSLAQVATAMEMSQQSARSALASSLFSAVTSGLVEIKKKS